jgi:hypothetical protein
MPIMLRVGGFAFGVYAGDHDPPHVHVRYAGTKCRIVLDTLQVKNGTMKVPDRAYALRVVAAHREQLHRAFEELRTSEGGGE